MSVSNAVRCIAGLTLTALLTAPAPAQGLQDPVIISYIHHSGHPIAPPVPGDNHPQQCSPANGGGQADIHSISPAGDLSHHTDLSGTRYILDVRWDPSVLDPYGQPSNPVLIVTPETTGTEANPTWSWDPANDTADLVLLDETQYTFSTALVSLGGGAARWAPDGKHVTFQATSVFTGLSGTYVAATLDADQDGQIEGLDANSIFLAAENAAFVNWGDSTRFSCYLSNHPSWPDGIYQYDLAGGATPLTLLALQPLNPSPSNPPIERYSALSPDGGRLAYSIQVEFNSGGAPIRNELMVLELVTLDLTQITNSSRAKNANDLRVGDWSPDGTELVYGAMEPPGPGWLSYFDVYKIAVAGNSKAKPLTRHPDGPEDQSRVPSWRQKTAPGGGAPPNAPSSLGATTASSSQIDLTWTDNSTDENGFEVERSLDQSAWSNVTTTAANATSHSDSGLAASTTYYYRVRAINGSGASAYSNVAWDTTSAGGGGNGLANSDVPVAGTVTGTYADTHSDDDTAQSIRERESGGKPANRYSYLEHQWTFDVAAGSTTFFLQAWHTANSEGDDFRFEYSTNGSNWQTLTTVTNTADPGSAASFAVGTSLSGTVWVRVMDLDQSQGARNLDTVFIEQMYFQ